MKLVTSKEMRDIELALNKKNLMPTILMMENAARDVAEYCLFIGKCLKNPKFLIVCGTGNNGGDGLAVARSLFFKKAEASIIFVGDEKKLKGDAKANMDVIMHLGIPILFLNNENDVSKLERYINTNNIIIDAIFGTGLDREVTGLYKQMIDLINRSEKRVVSIDIPSGINSDTGEVMGVSVNAETTVTLGLPKIGLFTYPGCEYAGDIVIRNSFMPQLLIDQADIKVEMLLDEEISKLLPKRAGRSNKGKFGKVFVIAGCDKMPGAAVLSSKAALRSGCGLVKACVIKSVANIIHNNVTEAVTLILQEKDGTLCADSLNALLPELKDVSCVLLGPGLSITDDTVEFLTKLLPEINSPLLLDADALNIISQDISLLKSIKNPFIITPHPAEMSRLTGKTVAEILKDPIKCASEFSKSNNCITVLKDAKTIVTSPEGQVYINNSGNNSLAKAGTGDALAGIIAGFIAQGTPLFTSCELGTYIHGRAGERASLEKSNYGVLASDLIEYVPRVLLEFTQFLI